MKAHARVRIWIQVLSQCSSGPRLGNCPALAQQLDGYFLRSQKIEICGTMRSCLADETGIHNDHARQYPTHVFSGHDLMAYSLLASLCGPVEQEEVMLLAFSLHE